MMNKPIFILSDSYQKYANFRSNTDFNAQSVAFLNIKGEESILLGPDLNNTKFRFVPDAPKTNNDLVLKSNKGVFSWVPFPTSGGGTTVINEGIKPPFELNPPVYNKLKWAYYITAQDENGGFTTAIDNAPIGTLFSYFNSVPQLFVSEPTSGLSIKVPASLGYTNDLARVTLELDPKRVSTMSSEEIMDCSVLRFFNTTTIGGKVPYLFTGDNIYMAYTNADSYVYVKNKNKLITKIVTEDVLNTNLEPIKDKLDTLSSGSGGSSTPTTPDNPNFTSGADIIKVYVKLTKLNKGEILPFVKNRGNSSPYPLSTFEFYVFSTTIIKADAMNSAGFNIVDKYIYNIAPLSKVLTDSKARKVTNIDMSVITEISIIRDGEVLKRGTKNILESIPQGFLDYLSFNGISYNSDKNNRAAGMTIRTNTEDTRLDFDIVYSPIFNLKKSPLQLLAPTGYKIKQSSPDSSVYRFINPLALFNVDGSSKLIPVFTKNGVKYLMFEIENMPNPVIPS